MLVYSRYGSKQALVFCCCEFIYFELGNVDSLQKMLNVCWIRGAESEIIFGEYNESATVGIQKD